MSAPAAPLAPKARPAPYDTAFAVLQGQFIEAVYSMYGADPANKTPAQTANFPSGYKLLAWVTMQDFILESADPVFYGVIAQSETRHDRYVLAIRGTSTWVEWWDDFTSINLVPFKDPTWGEVGYGFSRIYATLEVITPPRPGVAAAPQSLKAAGSFAEQVAAVVAAAHPPGTMAAPAAPPALAVTGHSLGSALATLYVADNAQAAPQPLRPRVSSLYTFASPRVGDAAFAGRFDALDLTSWRIVNSLDIVPRVPLGFTHVATAQQYDPGLSVWPTPSCWHSLTTYLHLVDPRQPLGAACEPLFPAAAPAPAERIAPAAIGVAAAPAPTAVRIPAGPVTVNITVNIGRAEGD